MLAHFAEVMKPVLERYFLGRFCLGRGSIHTVSEHVELQRDDLSPIARAAEVLGRIDRVGLGQPTAGPNELTARAVPNLLFCDRPCGDLVLKQCSHPNPEVPEQMVIRQTLPQ